MVTKPAAQPDASLQHMRADLTGVLRGITGSHADNASDLRGYVKGETGRTLQIRYVRELVGVLTTHEWVTVDEEDKLTPNWTRAKGDETIEDAFSRWMDEVTGVVAKPKLSGKTRIRATSPVPMAGRAVDASTLKPVGQDEPDASNPANLPSCRCGCGLTLNNRKTNYKPGHDARHAGAVAREAAESYLNEEWDSLFDSSGLVSPALRAKARNMADTICAKAKAKAQPGA